MPFNQDLKLLEKSLGKNLQIHIGNNIWQNAGQFLQNIPQGNWAFLSDDIIFKSCAQKLYEIIKRINPQTKLIICQPQHKITDELIKETAEKIQETEFLISCGSGIINDLSKAISTKQHIQYSIFASAPSMNGYLSETATIYQNGQHASIKCQAPIISVFDLDILEKSPTRLIRSGIADSLCFYTIHLDWLAAYFFTNDQSYIAWLADLLAQYTHKLSNEILENKPNLIKILTEHLIISGIAMRILGSSLPASQGEHLIAHYYNSNSQTYSKQLHGEDIALSTYYMHNLQANILQKQELHLNKDKIKQYQNYASFAKFSSESLQIFAQNCQNWPKIKESLKKLQHKPNALIASKINHQIENSNWQEEKFKIATKNSFKIRDRFTFLDIEFFTN